MFDPEESVDEDFVQEMIALDLEDAMDKEADEAAFREQDATNG
jgi:hypothetical protein